ncbi:MAG: TraR/DksA family transcriptional regulator [Candidatus Omnitrophica bacterium]|nr:TraR/DksA family transcriptional regulator [Candidatus Omnitrophota bacterium]
MDKRELGRFKKRLLKDRADILGGVDKITEETLKKSQRDASGDLSGYTFHMADMATDNYDREFSLGIADNERETLRKIDDALRRVGDNTYGKCLSCGKRIAKKRLMAVCHAEYCKKCQEKEEAQNEE